MSCFPLVPNLPSLPKAAMSGLVQEYRAHDGKWRICSEKWPCSDRVRIAPAARSVNRESLIDVGRPIKTANNR